MCLNDPVYVHKPGTVVMLIHLRHVVVATHVALLGFSTSIAGVLLLCSLSPLVLAARILSPPYETATAEGQLLTRSDKMDLSNSETKPTQDVLIRLATDGIAQDREFLGKTRFAVSQADRTYSYDLEPIPISAVLSLGDQYGTPLEALIRIEALRRDFRAAVPAEKFWIAPLEAIQGAVQHCVEGLESSQSKKGSSDVPQECSRSIQEQFSDLESAILGYATLHSLALVKFQKRDPVIGYRVRIKIEPPRAHVHVMTLLDYKKYRYSNTPAEQYQWNDLLDAENLLIGWYHYRVDWPQDLNGPEEGDFEITKAGTITFSPKSK
jgi:hypothetical protein